MNNDHETEESIELWADQTFGKPINNVSTAARALIEMAELMQKLCIDDNHPKAAEELADVEIVFARLWRGLKANRQVEIDKKMKINRERTWELDGHGHGQHVQALRSKIYTPSRLPYRTPPEAERPPYRVPSKEELDEIDWSQVAGVKTNVWPAVLFMKDGSERRTEFCFFSALGRWWTENNK